MLNVSEAVKQAYINGNAKTDIFLTVTTTDGVVHEYNPRNILSGSVSVVESLCSSETFDISRVEKNELTFTLFNITEDISGLQGGNVVAKQRVYTDASDETVYTDIPLGTYTIAEAMNDGDYLYKCTAYEATTVKLDNLIDEWWKNLTFPITLRNLAVSMFQYLGCAYDIPATFTNSDYSIETLNADFEGVTGAEILGYIQEIVGGFFKADRQGVIKLKVPTPVSSGLYPHIGLYPREGLYPRKSNRAFGDDTTAGTGDWDYPQIVGDLQLGDYDVKSVTKVQIRGTEDDIGIIAGSGTNTYVIQGNPLLFNLTAEDGATIAQNILDQVGQIAYKPFSGKFMAQPYVEVGDIAKIETYAGKEGDSPIFQRTLSGARLAFDNFQSLGLEYREQVSSVNRKLTTINQRTHEIKNTVDEMSSTVSNVEQRVTTNETNITQNANAISLSATRSGVFNLLVNSDFSNQANRTQSWEVSNVVTEYVYDENFQGGHSDLNKIENGYCLKITPTVNGACSFYQEINYSGTISEKLTGQITYRVLNTGGASFRPFIRVYSGSTSVIYTFVGANFLTDGKIYNQRWIIADSTFEQLSGVEITRIQYGVYISNGTTESQVEVNHFLLSFGNSVLPFWAWTNYASKDLISQINISPSGVKIQGNKVDIYGLTTFHNGDGTGGTTIDGATITAGDMYWYKDTSNEATLNGAEITLGGNTYSGVKLEASALLFKSANVIHNAIDGGLIQTNLTADAFSALCSTNAVTTSFVNVANNTALLGANDTSTGAKCRVTTNQTSSSLSYTNGSTSNAVTANANGLYLTGKVYSEGRRVIGCASGLATCQSGTADGHTVLNFFLDGTYVGHTVY